MRSPLEWDIWLAEYDQAATEAETYRVAELSQLDVVTKDFLAAFDKVAPINGRFAVGMSRKEMMKCYREHMMIKYPLRSGKHKAAFVPDASYPTEGDATPQSTGRDTSRPESVQSNGIQGKPRNQHTAGKKHAKLKRPSDQELALTEGAKCPACGQRHSVRDCYYVNPDKAPQWWKPNETINELINFKCMHDVTFQGLLRGKSRARS